jgi:hypothetical protein
MKTMPYVMEITENSHVDISKSFLFKTYADYLLHISEPRCWQPA